jgi:hypothetical protein
MHRSNKGSRGNRGKGAEPWWDPHIKRQKARKEMAKASKRKNRRK